jgi:hypothetical protein
VALAPLLEVAENAFVESSVAVEVTKPAKTDLSLRASDPGFFHALGFATRPCRAWALFIVVGRIWIISSAICRYRAIRAAVFKWFSLPSREKSASSRPPLRSLQNNAAVLFSRYPLFQIQRYNLALYHRFCGRQNPPPACRIVEYNENICERALMLSNPGTLFFAFKRFPARQSSHQAMFWPFA